MQQIELFPYQTDHVNILKKILKDSPFCLDFSMLGTGKTYTCSKLAMDLEFKNILVVCPVSVKSKWLHMKKNLGVPIYNCISFCELRSTKCKQPKHGLLARRDYTEKMAYNGHLMDVDKVEFRATEKFNNLIDQGVMLVIDEIQNIKNLSNQFYACRTLIEAISNQPKSKVILVSGSPIDKREQAVNLFRVLNILKSRELCTYRVYHRAYAYNGIQEIARFCGKPVLPNLEGYASCVNHTYRLFQKQFKSKFSNSMEPPATLDHKRLSKRNGYFVIRREEDVRLLKDGVNGLSEACSFNPEDNTVTFGGGNQVMSAMQVSLMQIETAKIDTFARLAREALISYENNKVVICVNYVATITDLCTLLAEFNPIVLQGNMNHSMRTSSIELFQESTSSNRLLIANVSVSSSGIDLDDKNGGFPRTVLISPMYNTITLYQLCHRFLRMDTRSETNIYMVYGKQHPEDRIVAALGRKSAVMKETTDQQAASGVEFPGDYKSFYE
jgi:hypothetical protein